MFPFLSAHNKMTPTSIENTQENASQVRRAAFVYALQTFRLGASEESCKRCLELMEMSTSTGDFKNLYASQRILAMLNHELLASDTQSINSYQSLMGDLELSRTVLQQRNFSEAIRLKQISKKSEAAVVLRSMCSELIDSGSIDVYTASAFNQLSTLARELMLETPRGRETTYEEYKRLYGWALANAKRVALNFEEEKPHTYREEAWEMSLMGRGGHSVGLTLRNLMSSLLRARALGFESEEIATFKAWDSMCHDYELGVPGMGGSERSRYNDLLQRAESSARIASKEFESPTTSTVDEGNLERDLEFCLQETLTELGSSINQHVQSEVVVLSSV